MEVGMIAAGIHASGHDDQPSLVHDSGSGNVKSMRAQKLQLNRDKSEPTDVYSWFEITLKSIDVPSQTFECSIEVHLFWQDFNLPNIFPEFEKEDFTIDDDDVPVKMSEIFENKLSADLEGDPVFQYFPDTGTIYMMFVCECTFVERMELQRFPLDRQFLNMEFNAWVEEGNWNWTLQPGLDWVPEPWRNKKFAVRMVSSITEYTLLGPWIDFTSDQPLSIRLRVDRVPTYYFGNIVFPNFLIVAGCFAAFAVPRSEVADRLSVTVTLMLAAVAFRFVVSTMLPKVSYLTIMDKYLLFGFIALIILIAENGFAGLSFITSEQAFWIDWGTALFFGITWIIIHVIAFLAVYWEDFYRVSWDEMDRIDSEEDPDAEFVKADPKFVKTPDESEYCKQQWAQSRLKSPTTRARLFEEAHPDLAEKNRSQFKDDDDDAGDEKKDAMPEVPSKVNAKASDLDIGASIDSLGKKQSSKSKSKKDETETKMATSIAVSNTQKNDNTSGQTEDDQLPAYDSSKEMVKQASKQKSNGYEQLDNDNDNNENDDNGDNEAIDRAPTTTDVVYDANNENNNENNDNNDENNNDDKNEPGYQD